MLSSMLLTAPARAVGRLVGAVLLRLRPPHSAPASPRPAPAPTTATPRTEDPTSVAGPGRRKYEAALLELVHAGPGITVAEAASELETNPSGLYPTMRRLAESGKLIKRGRGLHPPRPARGGKRDELLAKLVATRRGLTVAEAAAELDVHPTALYPVIRRLESQGRLIKLGRANYTPAERRRRR